MRVLDIQEKVKNGISLTNQEWLTDTDLKKAAAAFGLNVFGAANKTGDLRVIPFDKQNIGRVLHEAREAHQNDEPRIPYTIHFLLNTGGDTLSSGNHWIEASITVDPSKGWPPNITVSYSDSLTSHPDREKTLKEAIFYQDNDGDFAFPDCPMTITETNVEKQTDSWSCGYRALQSLVKKINPQNNAAAETFSKATTSAEMAQCVYGALLGALLPKASPTTPETPSPFSMINTPECRTIETDPEKVKQQIAVRQAMQQFKGATINFQKTQLAKKIDELEKVITFAKSPTSSYILTVKTTTADEFPDKSVSLPLFELKWKLHTIAAAYHKKMFSTDTIANATASYALTIPKINEKKLPPYRIPISDDGTLYCTHNVPRAPNTQPFALSAEVVRPFLGEKNTLTVDLNSLFAKKEKEDIKITVLAFIQYLNTTNPPVEQLIIENAHLIPKELAKEFEQMHFVSFVSFIQTPPSGKKEEKEEKIAPEIEQALRQTAARNRLMRHLNIKITDPNPWESYYRACFTRAGLNASCSDVHSLNIYNTSHSDIAQRLFQNHCLEEMGTAPLEGLLNFLDSHQNYFEKNNRSALFKEFVVGIGYADEYSEPNPSLACASLSCLAQHLEDKKYFPFETLVIRAPNVGNKPYPTFEQLKRIFNTLSNYPNIKNVKLLSQDGKTELTLEDEDYKALADSVDEKKLTARVQVSIYQKTRDKKTIIDGALLLQNASNRNIRAKNAAKYEVQNLPTEPQEKQTKITPLEEEIKIPEEFNQVPRWKLAGFDARKMAGVDVDISVAQQAEKQVQVQTQIQHQGSRTK